MEEKNFIEYVRLRFKSTAYGLCFLPGSVHKRDSVDLYHKGISTFLMNCTMMHLPTISDLQNLRRSYLCSTSNIRRSMLRLLRIIPSLYLWKRLALSSNHKSRQLVLLDMRHLGDSHEEIIVGVSAGLDYILEQSRKCLTVYGDSGQILLKYDL